MNIEPTDIYGRSDSLVKTWSKSQMEAYVLNPGVYPPFERTEAPQEAKQTEATTSMPNQEKLLSKPPQPQKYLLVVELEQNMISK